MPEWIKARCSAPGRALISSLFPHQFRALFIYLFIFPVISAIELLPALPK